MNEKAKLSKADFDLLEAEQSEEQLYWKERILLKVTSHRTKLDCDFGTLLRALVDGYEIETTPEIEAEKYMTELAENFNKYQTNCSSKREYEAEMRGAFKILKIFNIKISGVNAE